MHRLWPQPSVLDLDDAALAAHYAWPETRAVPYVRVNFVSSLDGAVTVDGRSGGLGNAADKKVFHLLRELAEVVLVGAGTVRAEKYNGVQRPTRGRDTPPPVAVVTGTAELDPSSALFTDTVVPPLILTLESAPARRRAAITEAGGEVVVLPRLTPDVLLAELARRGLGRVLCEGGPSLLGALHAADAVDELCLTVAPLLAGGEAGRIARGPAGSPARPMTLVGALQSDDALLLRYRRVPRPGRRRTAGMTGPHRHPTPEQRAAFRAFVRDHHPDRGGDPADVRRRRRRGSGADRGTAIRRTGPDSRAPTRPAGPLPFPVRVGVAVIRTWRRRHERSGPVVLTALPRCAVTLVCIACSLTGVSPSDRQGDGKWTGSGTGAAERPERGPRGGRWSPACCCASPRCSPGARWGRRSGRPSRCAGRTCPLHPPLRR